jgi:peptidoglycan/LPS O-acetylase OafA/YrhL
MGMHLWYLEALFLFSLLCLPLFLWLKKSDTGRRFLQGLGDLLARPGAAFLLALPALVLISLLDPDGWGTPVLGGWSILIYPFFFLSGFVIISNVRLQDSIRRWRWVWLATGIIALGLDDFLWGALGDPDFGSLVFTVACIPYCLAAWSWLLAIFGFAFQHLNRNKPFLRYANEAVLPFYILHQPVLLTAAFFVVHWAVPDWLKFGVIVAVTFAVSLALYEFAVRRVNGLRLLFGMKAPSRAAVPAPEPRVIAS